MSSDIYVCSLARLEETVASTKARYVVSAINPWSIPATPTSVPSDNHLRIAINDIDAPFGDLVHPEMHHIERIVQFARHWDRDGPLVVHCLAGISRSSASAFIVAAALTSDGVENTIAQQLRKASKTARPNPLMITLADQHLARNGRMIAAIKSMSLGAATMEAETFSIPSCY